MSTSFMRRVRRTLNDKHPTLPIISTFLSPKQPSSLRGSNEQQIIVKIDVLGATGSIVVAGLRFNRIQIQMGWTKALSRSRTWIWEKNRSIQITTRIGHQEECDIDHHATKSVWEYIAYIIRKQIWFEWMGMDPEIQEKDVQFANCHRLTHMGQELQEQLIQRWGALAIKHIANPTPDIMERYGFVLDLEDCGVL